MWTVFGSSLASSEEILGPWCLELVPGFSASTEVTNIILTDSGSYEARWIFSDGSSFTYDLREVGPGVFSIVYFEESTGDRLGIHPDGLLLSTNLGTLKIAKKIGPNEGRKECMEK